jgi:hypothetical protein
MSTLTKGNPEGSPSDPLTTDPKGEACHAPESPEIYVTRNTPALIVVLASMTVSTRWCTVDRDKAVYRSESV